MADWWPATGWRRGAFKLTGALNDETGTGATGLDLSPPFFLLFDQFYLETNPNFITNHHATSFESFVPGEAEILAIDCRRK